MKLIKRDMIIESKNDFSPYIYGLRFEEMCVVTEEGGERI